jgi:hypothetical protein
MDLDLSGLAIFIFAVFPGFFSNEIFKLFIGFDWKEEKHVDIIRSLSFSFFGLLLYIFWWVKSFHLPFPTYLLVSTFKENYLSEQSNIELLFITLLNHILASLLIGVFYVLIIWLFNKYSHITTYPNTWNQFCRQYVNYRWVCVHLQNGQIFRGKIKIVNDIAGENERDIVLEDPMIFSKEHNDYLENYYKFLFLQSKEIKLIFAMKNSTDLDSNQEAKK